MLDLSSGVSRLSNCNRITGSFTKISALGHHQRSLEGGLRNYDKWFPIRPRPAGLGLAPGHSAGLAMPSSWPTTSQYGHVTTPSVPFLLVWWTPGMICPRLFLAPHFPTHLQAFKVGGYRHLRQVKIVMADLSLPSLPVTVSVLSPLCLCLSAGSCLVLASQTVSCSPA